MNKRMVAYNAHETDEIGIVFCMVVEDEPGYRPMNAKGKAPWYLAEWADHDDEAAALKHAKQVVRSWNREHGYTKTDVMEVVTSAMRAQGVA